MSKNKDVKRGIVLYIDGKAVKSDVASIKAEIRKLTKELDRMAIGSKEYNEQMAKIRNLNTILKQHKSDLKAVNDEMKKSPGFIDKMVNGFNKFGGIIVSLIGFLTGVTLALRSFREERNKLESSQANLKSLTGLDDDSISWLTEQAKKLSTTMTKEGLRVRASANEILEAYMLVGGAKAELLENKEALAAVTEEAMRLQSAAGDITLAEAVDAVTLSLNQFGAPAEDAARYVNVLAAGSKEGASGVASITSAIKRAGVAAAGANVSIEETVALVETLAYKGITDEVAGTALKKFFLVLQTGADDTNPKVVGLAKALENLKAKNMGAADIKKMFGEEGYNAAAVILQNTEMVNQLTEAVTGTNIALEQSAINSNTAAAALDQARNKMKLAMADLGEKLDGVFTVSTNMATNLVKILPGLIDWVREWGLVTLWLAGVIAGYNARIKIAAMLTGSYNAVLKVGKSVQLAYGIATATVNGYTVTSIKLMRAMIITMGNHKIAMAALRTATFAYAAVVNVLRLRFDLAAKAMRGMIVASNISKLFSPWGAVLAVVTAITAALVIFRKRVAEVSAEQAALDRINKRASEEYDTQAAHVKQLNDVLHNNKVSIGERRKALDELKSIIPGYNAMLDDEGRLTKDNTKAIDDYLLALEKEIKLKAAKEELEEAYRKQRQLEKQRDTNQRVIDANPGNTSQTINTSFGAMNFDPLAHNRAKLREINAELTKTNAVISAINDEIAANSTVSSIASPSSATGSDASSSKGESDKDKRARIKKELEKIETDHNAELTHLQKLYLEGSLESEEEYAAAKIDLEKKYLNQKLDVVGLEPSEREKIQVKILEGQIKFNEQCKKEDERIAKERKSIRDKQLQVELEQAAQQHYRNFTSEEDYQAEVKRIYEQYYDDLLQNYRLTEEQKTQILAEQNKLQTEEDKKKYETLKAQAEQYADISMDIAGQFGEAIGEMIASGELSMKNFLKETILMALDALERIIEITCLEVTARNLAATAPFSWIGAAKAALQVAAIKAAFAVVKGLVGNFYTGGYTPSGDWDKPQGIVHSNEFVANRFAVANPAVRPVLDLIDAAQRSGTIANLTGGDIAAVAGSRPMTAAQAPVVVTSASQPNDRELMQTVRDLRQVISRLVVRLDEPIEAVGVISGRHGWKQKLDEYDQLLNNKSRRP